MSFVNPAKNLLDLDVSWGASWLLETEKTLGTWETFILKTD